MKNFQGLHKCATGAVINTEDFMKSNQSNIGSMLGGRDGGKVKQSKKARKNTPNRNFRDKCYNPNH
jgi:uncharacterized protein YbjQ (UPF0145 family)